MERAHARIRDVAALGTVLVCVLLAYGPDAFALDPVLDVSQYAHTAWKIRDGFSKGRIHTIAQTPDGYLWLGTEFGLLRFDGVRTVSWQPPPDQDLPSSDILGLLAARDGTLWIGTQKGLASWKEGKLTQYPELAGQLIGTLLEDREGSVWASGFGVPIAKLCAIHNRDVQCYGEDGSLTPGVFRLYEDRKGNLWAGVKDGLWRWKPGPPKFYSLPGKPDGIQGLSEDDDGALLFGWNGGVHRFVDGKMEIAYPLQGRANQVGAPRLLRDHDGGLWVGTLGRGLVHIHQGRTDSFARSDGLSDDDVSALFEDREGNIGVATLEGLDRFREFAVVTLSVNQGLSHNAVGPVLAARDGSVWIATFDGLNRWNNGQISVPRTGSNQPNGKINGQNPVSLFQDDRGRIVVSTVGRIGYLENDRFVPISGVHGFSTSTFAEDTAGNLWIATQDLGLFRLSGQGEVQQIPWARLGHQDPAPALAADPLQGGIWVGFYRGGIVHFADGQVRTSFTAADGLGAGRVYDFRFAHDNTMWVATDGGLSRLKNGRVATLTSKSGLPCDTVHSVIEDDALSVWLAMPCGLVRVARPAWEAWFDAVDKDKHSQRKIQPMVLDGSDGISINATVGGNTPRVARTSDGKLWFVTLGGVSVVDPRHLSSNAIPPPVHIEQVTADRKTYDPASIPNGQMSLPPLIRDLQIDYTALSFVAPEKVRFRYRLEGYDSDWQDAGTRRQAFYTNLPPRNYKFRVIASNNSDVWNETGTFLDFAVAPAYYQTTWFYALCVAAFLALLGALHQLRLRQASRQFAMRMDERTRIAQDLHDTLLQGCLSASMQLQLAIDHMPSDLPIRDTLSHVQQLMSRVVDEGRGAVRGLRASAPDTDDLAQAFSRTQKEVAGGEQVGFRVIVAGKRRPLRPVIRDEVYRIGREAILNAFRHAHAQHIEVEIDYAPRCLSVSVRDDGCGIDPAFLSSGREGHFGLSGMRERAERIGGRVNVSSRDTAGTEVDLSVPGRVAFPADASRGGMWLAKLIGKTPQGAGKTQSEDHQ